MYLPFHNYHVQRGLLSGLWSKTDYLPIHLGSVPAQCPYSVSVTHVGLHGFAMNHFQRFQPYHNYVFNNKPNP